jgi:hypothetical protein
MARFLHIVARSRLDLYDRLRDAFARDRDTEVILDRRRGERRQGERRTEGGRGLPGRRHGGDRRERRPDLDQELREVGLITVRAADRALGVRS